MFASGSKGSADNTKATNDIKNTLKNTLTEMKSLTVKDKFKGIFEGAEQIVAASKGMIKDMVNTTFDALSPELKWDYTNYIKMSMEKVLAKLEI